MADQQVSDYQEGMDWESGHYSTMHRGQDSSFFEKLDANASNGATTSPQDLSFTHDERLHGSPVDGFKASPTQLLQLFLADRNGWEMWGDEFGHKENRYYVNISTKEIKRSLVDPPLPGAETNIFKLNAERQQKVESQSPLILNDENDMEWPVAIVRPSEEPDFTAKTDAWVANAEADESQQGMTLGDPYGSPHHPLVENSNFLQPAVGEKTSKRVEQFRDHQVTGLQLEDIARELEEIRI
ncbi:hypothetical protein BJ875DRAFT_30892 [Amylocarpus encephaloides]|uniref:Uncharacterized protein n=1 Tax=Amylocarpus encephaloides TaxID=45428 RepID=A0A9P7YIL7_9HELO|nr:hypothetical protein BJ875DRAFT_30892 [Amylocarpus encephaloides]